MKSLDDLTTQCIRCGFCLDACPTYKLTGSELESPRGRIYLARSAEEGHLDWAATKPHFDRCLGCLACEPACPSAVKYGEILELARERIEEAAPSLAKEVVVDSATSPAMLRLGSLSGGAKLPDIFGRFFGSDTMEARLPRPEPNNLDPVPLAEPVSGIHETFAPGVGALASGTSPVAHDGVNGEVYPVRLAEPVSGTGDPFAPGVGALASGTSPVARERVKGEVYFLEGCAMRVLYPRVHACTKRLLRRIGYAVRVVDAGCCGSMHAHNGYLDEAKARGEALMAAMHDDLPVIVDSAGCGSTMKRYNDLIPGSEGFARRVRDASEFLFERGLVEALKTSPGLPGVSVTYHDACHLAHGQGIRDAPRELLRAIPGIDLRELVEADMCCGSAGIYNVVQPKMARELLDRKLDNVEKTAATIVATGNPGCHAWMAQGAREADAKYVVRHTMEVLKAAFIGLAPFEAGTRT